MALKRLPAKNVLFLWLFYVVFAFNGMAQQKLDSLLKVNNSYTVQDSMKVMHYVNLMRQYGQAAQFGKVEAYGDSAVTLAQRLKLWYAMELAYKRWGIVYHGNTMYANALTCYQKALELAKRNGDASETANISLNMGALYMDIPDYAQSLAAHQVALPLYNQLGKMREVGSCYMNIGQIYAELNQVPEALSYMTKALKVFEGYGVTSRGVAVASEAIAMVYMRASDEELVKTGLSGKEKYNKALEALNRALPIAFMENEPELAASIYAHIGDVYAMNGNRKNALANYEEALKLNKKHENRKVLAENMVTIGNYYCNGKEYDKALAYLSDGLRTAKQSGITGTQKKALEGLSCLFEKKGNYDSALHYFRQFIVFKDSIYNQEKEKEITRRQLKIDFDIRERNYRLTQQVTDAKLQQHILMAKQRQQQLELADKEKRLQRLSFLKKQADLENEKKIQAGLLQQEQLRYRFDKQLKDKQISNQQMQLEYNRKLIFFFALIAILVLSAALLIYFNLRKTARLNRLVSEQKQALEELVCVKDKIFSVVSHDMRSPINTLVSFTHLLEDNAVSPGQLSLYSAQLRKTLSHTSALMENLLNWSATQMNGFKPILQPVDAGVIVAEVINSITPQSTQKGIYIHNHVSDSLRVMADHEMLKLVIRNLLGNAVKYSHPKGLIEFKAEQQGPGIVISVVDEGVGMAKEKIEQINIPVIQAIDSTYGTGKEKGTGLGLLLCKTFIGMMGGKLIAGSEPGKGTVMNVILPLIV